MKRILYILLFAVIIAGLAANRVAHISEENAREVFNIARFVKIYGAPVETMTARTERDFLRAPVAVRRERIFVSGSRINEFRAGQRLSNGSRILSVPRRVDLDTGLFTITTNSPPGNFFVEIEHTGMFVPLYAISDSSVMVAENGIAAAKRVRVVAEDIDRAVIRGLAEGDVIILTNVEPAAKIRPVIQR
ncbi:MAG: hypothetical protein FWG57_09410 [Endomicrobia bacterium]|nr:hypothetical protein [Endomicrobiia bacterium]